MLGILRSLAPAEAIRISAVLTFRLLMSPGCRLPVPEDWSILVEKAAQLPEQPSLPSRQQQMTQQQQAADSIEAM